MLVMGKNYDYQPVLIDLRDLVCFVFKKTRNILIVACIFGICLFGYKYVKFSWAASVPGPSALDAEVRLSGESDEAYSYRVAQLERAYGIVDSINYCDNQIQLQNEYLANSILMQIDPNHTPVSCLQAVIVWDEDVEQSVRETISDSYEQNILYGDYLTAVADGLGCDADYLSELINLNMMPSNSIDVELINRDMSSTINVSVVGPSIDFTECVVDAIVQELEECQENLNASYSGHTVEVLVRQNGIYANDSVRDAQLEAVMVVGRLQFSIDKNNTYLDSIAANLGYSDRNVFYQSIPDGSAAPAVSMRSLVKFGAIGFIGGAVAVAVCYILLYLYGSAVMTQKQFFLLFRDVDKVGVCKPANKRSALVTYLDRKSYDDSNMSYEDTNRIIKANYLNQTADMSKILITGTADSKLAMKTIKDIGLNGDVKLDLFADASIIKNAADYDGIVIVEQRGVSDKRSVKEEIRLLSNSGTPIVGAIVL